MSSLMRFFFLRPFEPFCRKMSKKFFSQTIIWNLKFKVCVYTFKEMGLAPNLLCMVSCTVLPSLSGAQSSFRIFLVVIFAEEDFIILLIEMIQHVFFSNIFAIRSTFLYTSRSEFNFAAIHSHFLVCHVHMEYGWMEKK